jgi:hypothetical protein
VIRLYVAAFLAVVVGLGLGWAGKRLYQAGYEACRAERAVALEKARSDAADAAELASRKEAERLAAEASRALLAAELEDLANADPVVAADCFSADRVRRLNLR